VFLGSSLNVVATIAMVENNRGFVRLDNCDEPLLDLVLLGFSLIEGIL
jgi:hypothetical protein